MVYRKCRYNTHPFQCCGSYLVLCQRSKRNLWCKFQLRNLCSSWANIGRSVWYYHIASVGQCYIRFGNTHRFFHYQYCQSLYGWRVDRYCLHHQYCMGPYHCKFYHFQYALSQRRTHYWHPGNGKTGSILSCFCGKGTLYSHACGSSVYTC